FCAQRLDTHIRPSSHNRSLHRSANISDARKAPRYNRSGRDRLPARHGTCLIGQCANFRFAKRIIPVAASVDRSRTLEPASKPNGGWARFAPRLHLARGPLRPSPCSFHYVKAKLSVPSSWESKVRNAIKTVHERTP